MKGKELLRFRCTGCGNCCKEPLLPLNDADLRRIVEHTGEAPKDVVKFVDRDAIDMDDEPHAFLRLKQGKRVMVLRHAKSQCKYLDKDDRCGIYEHRPLGCRVFPFDPTFTKKGELRRLVLIPATDCVYELDGKNDPDAIRELQQRLDDENMDFHLKIAEWNRLQRNRRRRGKAAQTARKFFEFLELQ